MLNSTTEGFDKELKELSKGGNSIAEFVAKYTEKREECVSRGLLDVIGGKTEGGT